MITTRLRPVIAILVVLAAAMLVIPASAQTGPLITRTPTPPFSVVIPADIYVRSGPGAEYPTVGSLRAGNLLRPRNLSEDREWVLIAYGRGVGWVRRDLGFWVEALDELPVLAATGLTVTPAPGIPEATFVLPTSTPEGNWVRLEGQAAYLRAGPGLNYPIVDSLPPGSLVESAGRDEAGDWILVRRESGFAWIARPLVSWADDLDELPILVPPFLTPSPTFTRTPRPSRTPTDTPTLTPSATRTPRPTATPSASATPSATHTSPPTATVTTSKTPSPEPTVLALVTNTPFASTARPATETPAPIATATASVTSTATSTPSATATVAPSATATPTPTATLTPSPTLAPTRTASPTPTATLTPSRTASTTTTASATPSATFTRTSTLSPTPSPTPTPAPTETPSATETAVTALVVTAPPTATRTPQPSHTLTPSRTPSATPAASDTPPPTSTMTLTARPTRTPSPPTAATAVSAQVNTPAPVPTDTPEPATPTSRPTRTATLTVTPSPTASPTRTSTPTRPASATPTRTAIPSATATDSASPTPRPSQTPEATVELTAQVIPGEAGPGEPPAPTAPSTDNGPALLIGLVALVAILIYGAFYWRGAAAVDRYRNGFIIHSCPVCGRGELEVETRVGRILGIPRPMHTIRCDSCRSLLREVRPGHWRYAVDPMENAELAQRYNGKVISAAALRTLDLNRRGRGPNE